MATVSACHVHNDGAEARLCSKGAFFDCSSVILQALFPLPINLPEQERLYLLCLVRAQGIHVDHSGSAHHTLCILSQPCWHFSLSLWGARSSKILILEVCVAAGWSFPHTFIRITVWTLIRQQDLKSFWVISFSQPQGLSICIHLNPVGQAFVQCGGMGINIPIASTPQRRFEFPQKGKSLGYICNPVPHKMLRRFAILPACLCSFYRQLESGNSVN